MVRCVKLHTHRGHNTEPCQKRKRWSGGIWQQPTGTTATRLFITCGGATVNITTQYFTLSLWKPATISWNDRCGWGMMSWRDRTGVICLHPLLLRRWNWCEVSGKNTKSPSEANEPTVDRPTSRPRDERRARSHGEASTSWIWKSHLADSKWRLVDLSLRVASIKMSSARWNVKSATDHTDRKDSHVVNTLCLIGVHTAHRLFYISCLLFKHKTPPNQTMRQRNNKKWHMLGLDWIHWVSIYRCTSRPGLYAALRAQPWKTYCTSALTYLISLYHLQLIINCILICVLTCSCQEPVNCRRLTVCGSCLHWCF